jgi:homoserine kinase
MSQQQIRVRVPASSANLGPGFDALALALGLYLRCALRPSTRGLKITASGADTAEIACDESNLVWKSFVRLAGKGIGTGFELEIANEIPLGKGLGSSAAAIVAGLMLADAWTGANSGKQRLVEMATEIEGHPDNVAAAALGGLVASCHAEDGAVLTASCVVPGSIQVVVAIPAMRLSTEAARSVLPAQYSRQDAVFNAQRAALLIAALQSGRSELLREAMRDRIHQPYRASLIPGLAEALQLRDVPGLLAIALSGAGPSILALCDASVSGAADQVGDALAGVFRSKGISAEARLLSIDSQGAVIERE